MPELGKAYIQVIPTTKGIKQELENQMDGPGKEAGKKTGTSIGTAIKNAIVAIGIGEAIKTAVNQGAELQQNLGGTEAVFGDFASSIKASAEDAYKNMGLSASDYMATANKMGSLFQGSGLEQERAMDLTAQAMQRAADVASVMGLDTTAAMESIAGAAKGNFTMMDNLGVAMNATTLQAYALEKGVNFNWNTASNAEKAELAMQMFFDRTEQYAGNFAEESEKTFSGSLGAMQAAAKNVLGNLALGENIWPSLNALSQATMTFLSENAIPMITSIVEKIPGILDAIVSSDFLPTLAKAGVDMLTSLVRGFSETIPLLLDDLSFLIIDVVNLLVDSLPQLIEGAVLLFTGLIEAIPIIIPRLANAIPSIVEKVASVLIQNAPVIFRAALQLLGGILKAIPNVLKAAVTGLWGIGSNLVKGLWNGISDVTGWILDKIRGFGNSILSGIKGIFGIHSPSKEMEWMGEMLDRGLAKGITGGIGDVEDAMGVLGNRTMWSFDPTISAAGGSAGAITNMGGVSINVYGKDGQNARDIAEAVMAEIQAAVDRRGAVFA